MSAEPTSGMNPVRAAIYVRVSSPGQEDNYSLPSQEEECKRYCAERGYLVTDEHLYRDGAQSSYTLDRPGLETMREELRTGHLDVIVALKMDRLSRDQVQQGVLIYEADRYGVRLEFVLEAFDDTPTGHFLRSAQGFVAEVERASIRERTQRGRRKRARGTDTTPPRPIAGAFPAYGLLWRDSEKSGYVHDPEAGDVVKRIWRDVARGVPLRTLARTLDAEGVPTPSQTLRMHGLYAARPTASHWSTATLHRLLMNPLYVGEPVAWRWRGGTRDVRQLESGLIRKVHVTKVRADNDSERIPLPPEVCLPLIDRETAEAAWAQLRKNQQEAPRRNSDPHATLLRSGYISCGYCGHPLYTHRVRGKWMYFCSDYRRRAGDGKPVCPSGSVSMLAKTIDSIVWEHVCRVIASPEHLAQALARWQTEHETVESRASAHADAVAGQLRKLQAKQANLAQAVAEAATVEARVALTTALDGVSEQLRTLTAELERLQAACSDRATRAAQVATLAEWANTISRRLDTFTYAEKRITLYALGVHVTLWRFDHTPRFEITFDFQGLNSGLAPEPVTEERRSVVYTSRTT